MPEYGWFLIGAAVGAAQLGLSIRGRRIRGAHPIQGILAAAVSGAAIYGTILWAVFEWFT